MSNQTDIFGLLTTLSSYLQKDHLVALNSNFYVLKFDDREPVIIEKDQIIVNILVLFGGKEFQVIVNQKKILITHYYINGQYEALCSLARNLDISKNYYILCVGYPEGDFQPGLTGTIPYDEEYGQTAMREIYEEVGFDVNRNDLQYINTNSAITNGFDGHIYSVDASKCIKTNKKYVYKRHRNTRKKICVFIYGSFLEMKRIITEAKKIDPNETIDKFAIIRVPEAIKIVKRIMNNSSRDIGHFGHNMF